MLLAPGPLVAPGRDSEISEYGPGVVLRRSRNRRSMEKEAKVIGYVAHHGYPVPRVEEISADGSELVMERIDGATMLEVLSRRPWTLRRHAAVLAALHDRLHEIPGQQWLDPLLAGGDCLVHLDLHPLNVILFPKGPVLIDWSNAACGAGPADVALTWLLMMAGEIQGSRGRQPSSLVCSDVCSSVHFSVTSTWHPSGPSSRPSGCGNAKTGTWVPPRLPGCGGSWPASPAGPEPGQRRGHAETLTAVGKQTGLRIAP